MVWSAHQNHEPIKQRRKYMFRIDKDDNSIKPLKARSFLGGAPTRTTRSNVF